MAESSRDVSSLGDRREQEVACRRCSKRTLALDALCDRCFIIEAIRAGEIINVTRLSDSGLVYAFNLSLGRLRELREVALPRTDEAQSWHSLHDACLIEMRKRGF